MGPSAPPPEKPMMLLRRVRISPAPPWPGILLLFPIRSSSGVPANPARTTRYNTTPGKSSACRGRPPAAVPAQKTRPLRATSVRRHRLPAMRWSPFRSSAAASSGTSISFAAPAWYGQRPIPRGDETAGRGAGPARQPRTPRGRRGSGPRGSGRRTSGAAGACSAAAWTRPAGGAVQKGPRRSATCAACSTPSGG